MKVLRFLLFFNYEMANRIDRRPEHSGRNHRNVYDQYDLDDYDYDTPEEYSDPGDHKPRRHRADATTPHVPTAGEARRRSVSIGRSADKQSGRRISAASSSSQASTDSCRQRAPPGATTVLKKSLAFSNTPETSTTQWKTSTISFNKRIFCEAIGAVAAHQGRLAAAALWDRHSPRNNESLDALLEIAMVKITVCEGLELLEIANEYIKAHSDELSGQTPRQAAGRRDDGHTETTGRGRRSSVAPGGKRRTACKGSVQPP